MSFRIKDNLLVNTLLLIVTFGIVIASGSLYKWAFNYNLIMVVVLAFMIAIIVFQYFIPRNTNHFKSNNYTISFNTSEIIIVLLFIIIPTTIDILNLIPSFEITYFYVAMILLTFLLGEHFRKKILDYYLLIIILLSIISLGFFILNIFHSIPGFIPNIVTKNHTTIFYFLWSQPLGETFIPRNQSIFWEPGGFGYHLVIAMMLSLHKRNNLFLLILVITALTTLSTTVFFIIGLVSISHLLSSNNKIKIILFYIFALFAFIVAIRIVFGNYDLPISIMKAILEKFDHRTGSYFSFLERKQFFVESFKLYLDNFILGTGHYGTAFKLSNVSSQSSGLVGLLAELGIFGVICIILYIRFFKIFGILSIPITLIWLNGEFMQYTPISIFILGHMASEYAPKLLPHPKNMQQALEG